MKVQPKITFRDNLRHSAELETHIQERLDKLQQFNKNITACHVVVELANKNHRHGKLHNIHLTLTIPGKELVSTRNEHENMYLSIRDAFDDMTRQLEEHAQQLQGRVKNHEPILSGKVTRLIDGEFGFIEGTDGTEFYFNKGHLTNGHFNQLTVGTPVHFVEAMGDKGPQARRVKIAEKPE